MITLQQIQEKLIEAIKQSGMTQTALAKALNIKQQTIACYIAGKAMPALDTLANLCVILDIDPADILCTDQHGTQKKTTDCPTSQTKIIKNVTIKF